MRLTGKPVFVSVPLHYAGFLSKVDVCCAWNLRQFLQELHSNTVKPTSYLYSHYKSDSSIYSTLNCCSKPEHFACGSSFCMSPMTAPSSWATTAVFPQRRYSLRASWMKAYWSYGKITLPLIQNCINYINENHYWHIYMALRNPLYVRISNLTET